MNLNESKVSELKTSDLQQVNGGWIWPVLGLLGGMINDAQNNPDDFAAGMKAWGY
ncbi:MAG: hypothetical protein AAF433_17550 [Bacteroidota bacterium]